MRSWLYVKNIECEFVKAVYAFLFEKKVYYMKVYAAISD